MLRSRGSSRARAYASFSRAVSSVAAIARLTGGGGGTYSLLASAPEQAIADRNSTREKRSRGKRQETAGVLLQLPAFSPENAVVLAVPVTKLWSGRTGGIPAHSFRVFQRVCT